MVFVLFSQTLPVHSRYSVVIAEWESALYRTSKALQASCAIKMADYSSKTVLRSFGGPDHKDADGDFLITQAHHMAYNDGNVYVSEMLSHSVKVLQCSDGTFVRKIGSLGFFDGEFDVPSGVTFLDGKTIICDLNNGRLQSFDADGSFLSEFGSKGDGPGSFTCPNSLCSDAAGDHLFVAEAGNKRVQVFDKDFNHKSFICGPPFASCDHVGFDKVGNRLIVTDCEADTVSLFDPATGRAVCKLAGENGEFKGAMKATGDSAGNILVCEMGEGKVTVFDKDGRKIGLFAAGYDFSNPEDISISENGEVFVLEGNLFSGWNRVSVF